MAERTRMYERWDIHQRAQHWLMLGSFLLVSVTGIPIKFAYAAWAQAYVKLFGSFETLFQIHKLGALVMIISAVYHLLYLVYKAYKQKLSWTMIPLLKDLTDFGRNIAFFCGFTKTRPQFKKYSFKEKMDYWAVYWGTPIMVLSGLVLWFPGRAINVVPKWMIDSAHFLHQDEGLLAVLFIFSVHFYNVHFSPDSFPMNYTWLTGQISRQVMEHEHPLELARIEEEERKNEQQVPQQPTAAH